MTPYSLEDLYEHVESVLDSGHRDAEGFAILRPLTDGWFMASGPICNFFIGESHTPDEECWLVIGVVARRTRLAGDAESEFDESYRYRLLPTEKMPASETPLVEPSDRKAWWVYFVNAHDRVVASLARDDLIYDGWIVWKGERRGTVVTLPPMPDASSPSPGDS